MQTADDGGDRARARLSLPKRVLLRVVVLATLGLAGAWIVAWIPAWPFALFEHFRVQYVVSSVAVLALAIALRAPRAIDAIAIVAMLHLLPIGADLAGTPQRGPAEGVAIRVLIANVWTQGEGRSGLCDSRAGFGVQTSFPTGNAVLRIPIDHLLASCAIGVRDRRIGRHVGSDHFPVIVDLIVPR